jgi:hypothetical protein
LQRLKLTITNARSLPVFTLLPLITVTTTVPFATVARLRRIATVARSLTKGAIVTKELHEMTIPELQAERLAAVDANDAGYVELIGHYIAARYAGHTS